MKWEYKIVELAVKGLFSPDLPSDVGVQLDKYGIEGWELIRVEPILHMGLLGGSYTSAFVLFFKRPLQS